MDELLKDFLTRLRERLTASRPDTEQTAQKTAPPQNQPTSKQNEAGQLIYRPVEIKQYRQVEIETISLTSKEAVQMGFSFRKKSKSIRITNYHGNAEMLTIPSVIDGKKVNEIGEKAFSQNQTIKILKIPGSIKKIGKSAFSESILESCLFADGMAYIPEHAFACCLHLSDVRLPWNVAEIRNRAFAYCYELKYIDFPRCCHTYADHAFFKTGLTGFGHEKSYYSVHNGLAFLDTPLIKNYALVLGDNRPECMNVLLVGQKAGKGFRIPPGNIHFNQNAFLDQPASLDITQCGTITFFDAFVRIRPGMYKYSNHLFPTIALHFPKHYQNSVHLPFFVRAYLGDSSQPPKSCIKVRTEVDKIGETNVMSVENCSRLCSNDMGTANLYAKGTRNHKAGKLIINGSSDILCRIEEQTFDLPSLSELTLNLKFYPEGKIFSPNCVHLHRMTWEEDGQTVTKYIPDISYIHNELMEAFVMAQNHFFDSRKIAQIFWHGKTVHTRERIFIAIDALRSTQRECDINPDFYLDYLKHHLDRAYQVCEKYPEYLKFLNTLK